MEFWKMNGAGNDFIILDNRKEKILPNAFPFLAKTLCERHLSLGADGLMIVEAPQKGGDLRLVFFNPDGTEGEMCGNGARCLCRYAFENGLSGEMQTLETKAGSVTGKRISTRDYQIALPLPSVLIPDFPLTVNGTVYPCAYAELGDPGIPHAVVPIDGLADYPEEALRRLGRAIRCHSAFPKGVNVNFYELTGQDEILEKTYERGVEDFTYACGTGTGSLAAVLTLKGTVSGRHIRVRMRGGELIVDVRPENGRIAALLLTGPTNIVAKGIITDESLETACTAAGNPL